MKRILKEQSNKDSVNNWDEAIKACSILQKTDGKKYKDKTSGVITLKQDNDDSVIIYYPDYTKKTIIKSTGKISDDTWDCPSYRGASNVSTIDDKEILDLGKEEKPDLPKDEERKRKVCKKSIELLIQGVNNFKRYDKNNKPSKKDFPFGNINDINKVKSVASRCVAQNNKFMGKEYYRDIEFLTTRLNPSEGKQNVDLKTIGEDFPMGLYQGLFSLINFKYEPGMAPKPAKQVKEPSSDNEPKPAEEPSSNKEPKSFDIKPIPSNDTIKGNEVMGKNSLKENNMKNIVRKNLLEVKNKKNSQLSENKIVKSRFFILTENKQPKTKKEIFVVLEDVKKEINYLQSQNFNNELIAEQALDYLQSVLPDAKLGIVETFKEYVVGLILKTMGVDTNGWIATIVQTTIASVPISDLPKLLSDCHYTSNVLTKSIIKGIIYKFQKEKGMDNAFMNILRNTMIEVVEDSAKNLENKLSDLICNKLKSADFKMGDMIDNLKSHIADFSF